MAVKVELVIEIAPDGTTRIKTHGFKGGECDEELKPIEKALGQVKSRERTSEFYEKATVRGKVGTGTK